jgi:hypothetical protein
MEFKSSELNNAIEVPSSITITDQKVETINIDDAIQTFVLSQDKTLMSSYNYGRINHSKATNGTDLLKSILKLCKDLISDNINGDTNAIKKLTIKKIFDSMIADVEAINLMGCNTRSSEVAAALLGFLCKNHLK